MAELERISGLTQAQARDRCCSSVEEHGRHDMAKLVRQIEEEAKVEADRRARNILSVAIQRTASGHTAETTVSVVQLASDDLKGRIIGREGRNIRALENAHRRRRDHRRHAPGRRAVGLRRRAPGDGQADAREADRRRPHPSLPDRGDVLPVEGRDRGGDRRGTASRPASRRTCTACTPSWSRCWAGCTTAPATARTCSSTRSSAPTWPRSWPPSWAPAQKTARRAALLHDIGKAVTHEVEGSHAVISAEMARKLPRVAQRRPRDRGPPLRRRAADGRGGAGDRGRRRLGLAPRRTRRERSSTTSSGSRRWRRSPPPSAGVERCYAMQAGREIRVMVKPEEVDDDTAALLSHEIAREIERHARVSRPDQGDGDPRVTCGGRGALGRIPLDGLYDSSHIRARPLQYTGLR